MLDAERRFQDRERNDKIKGKNDILCPVDTQTMRIELFAENIAESGNIFGEFSNDVKVVVGFNKASRRSSSKGSHVGDEEATVECKLRFGSR